MEKINKEKKYMLKFSKLQDIYGKLCPCLIANKENSTIENMCPCDTFIDTGVCRCGLFVEVKE